MQVSLGYSFPIVYEVKHKKESNQVYFIIIKDFYYLILNKTHHKHWLFALQEMVIWHKTFD